MRLLNTLLLAPPAVVKETEKNTLRDFDNDGKVLPSDIFINRDKGNRHKTKTCIVHQVTVTENHHKEDFSLQIQSTNHTFPCFRRTLISKRLCCAQLIDELCSMQHMDLIFNCTVDSIFKIYSSLCKSWYGKQRNLTFNIQNGIQYENCEDQKNCTITVIKLLHRILEAEDMKFNYSPLIREFRNKLQLSNLPSRIFEHRSFTVNCKGLYISRTTAIKAILTVNSHSKVLVADRSTFEEMVEIIEIEAKNVRLVTAGRMVYKIGNYDYTLLDPEEARIFREYKQAQRENGRKRKNVIPMLRH